MLISMRCESQHGENSFPVVQYLLSAVRVKGGGSTSCPEQLSITVKDLISQRSLVCHFLFKHREFELLAIDGAIPPGQFNAFTPAARTKQTMEIDAWHAYE